MKGWRAISEVLNSRYRTWMHDKRKKRGRSLRRAPSFLFCAQSKYGRHHIPWSHVLFPFPHASGKAGWRVFPTKPAENRHRVAFSERQRLGLCFLSLFRTFGLVFRRMFENSLTLIRPFDIISVIGPCRRHGAFGWCKMVMLTGGRESDGKRHRAGVSYP
ncbi:hypothetical protein CEB3_c35010 [Peptococcaceae bacterium CEB3]|nr:hypothetical protein CEB3_c35010 [Peptococcaceae bacterium CEB3]